MTQPDGLQQAIREEPDDDTHRLVHADWWVGSEPGDIPEDLNAFTADGYQATAFWPVVCPCGGNRFRLERASSCTRRTCAACASVRHVNRFGEALHWGEAAEDSGVEPYGCVECGGDEANVCLGFAGYETHPGHQKGKSGSPAPDAILWFFVGVRCARCGVLGCFNDGKVGRGPMGEKTFREIAGEQGDWNQGP